MIQFDRLTPDEKQMLKSNEDYEEVLEKIRQGLGVPASLLEGAGNFSGSRVHMDLFNRWLAGCRAVLQSPPTPKVFTVEPETR